MPYTVQEKNRQLIVLFIFNACGTTETTEGTQTQIGDTAIRGLETVEHLRLLTEKVENLSAHRLELLTELASERPGIHPERLCLRCGGRDEGVVRTGRNDDRVIGVELCEELLAKALRIGSIHVPDPCCLNGDALTVIGVGGNAALRGIPHSLYSSHKPSFWAS